MVLSASNVRGAITGNRFVGSSQFSFANAIFIGGSNRLDIANNLVVGNSQGLVVSNAPDAPFALSIVRNPLALQWKTQAKVAYRVWISTDLLQWSKWQSVDASPIQRTITVPLQAGDPRAFYRLSR